MLQIRFHDELLKIWKIIVCNNHNFLASSMRFSDDKSDESNTLKINLYYLLDYFFLSFQPSIVYICKLLLSIVYALAWQVAVHSDIEAGRLQ